MFNNGDLVKVLYLSVDHYNIHNRVSTLNVPGSRTKVYQSDSTDISVNYKNKVPCNKIGKVVGSYRGALYIVDIDGQQYNCFPDELELVYTV